MVNNHGKAGRPRKAGGCVEGARLSYARKSEFVVQKGWRLLTPRICFDIGSKVTPKKKCSLFLVETRYG